MIGIQVNKSHANMVSHRIQDSLNPKSKVVIVSADTLNEAIEKGIVIDVDHIDVVEVIEKGVGGKRDVSKLQKKTITNKNGHRMTVYVKVGGESGDKKTAEYHRGEQDKYAKKWKETQHNKFSYQSDQAKEFAAKNVHHREQAEKLEKESKSDFNPNGLMQKKDVSAEDMKKIEGHEDKLSHINRVRYDKMLGKKDTEVVVNDGDKGKKRWKNGRMNDEEMLAHLEKKADGFNGKAALSANEKKIYNKLKHAEDKKPSGQLAKVLDTLQTHNNKYTDIKKVTVMSTPEGNWRLYYDNKDTGATINANALSDEIVEKHGMEHRGEFDDADGKEEEPQQIYSRNELVKLMQKYAARKVDDWEKVDDHHNREDYKKDIPKEGFDLGDLSKKYKEFDSGDKFPDSIPDEIKGKKDDIYILKRKNGDKYLVDPQGYDYPRYVLKINLGNSDNTKSKEPYQFKSRGKSSSKEGKTTPYKRITFAKKAGSKVKKGVLDAFDELTGVDELSKAFDSLIEL